MSAALAEPDDAPQGDGAPITEDEIRAFARGLDEMESDPEVLTEVYLRGWLVSEDRTFAIDLSTVRAVTSGLDGYAYVFIYGCEDSVRTPFSTTSLVHFLFNPDAVPDTAPAGFPHAVPSKPNTPTPYL